MRPTLLCLTLGLAAVGVFAVAPAEARAHGWGSPVVVVGYAPPVYYPPPVVVGPYYAAPVYQSYYVAPIAYYAPAAPRVYVAPANYGGFVGWGRGYVRWGVMP